MPPADPLGADPLRAGGADPVRVDASLLHRALPMADAVAAVEAALAAGLDPEGDPPRSAVDLPGGQLLLMPSAVAGYAGVKVVSVAPANPALGLPRIQGCYVLLDAATLTPRAVLDGAALTALRTPATTAVAVRHLATADSRRLVLFGTGPQAWGHLSALCLVRPVEAVTVVGRDPGRTAAFLARCRSAGVAATAGTPESVAGADLVACCTTAREPLFDGGLLPRHATVVAMGSHEPAAREVDEHVVARATVVVESRAAAAREAGDLIIAAERGGWSAERVAGTLADLVCGRVEVEPGRPRLYKSVGMAWQDVLLAAAVYERVR